VQAEKVGAESDDPLQRGVQAAGKGDTVLALSYFEQAVRAKPGRPAGYLRAAKLLRDLGRLDEAEAKFRAALAVAPENAAAMIGLAHIAREKNDDDSALMHLQNAQKAEPDNPKVLMPLGNALRTSSRWVEAQAVYEKLIEKEPSNAKAMTYLGETAQARGDADSAIAWFRRALALNPNLSKASALLAELLGEGNPSVGKNTGKPADPENERLKPFWRSVRTARRKGKDAEAFELLHAASLTEPGNVEILEELGASLRKLDRLDEAEGVYRDILSRDARNARAYIGLGMIARAHRDEASALTHFTAAAEIDPDNLQVRLLAAEILVKQNRSEDADVIFQSVLARSPKDPKVLSSLGVVAQKNKNWNGALTYFQAAAAAAGPSKVQYRVQLGKAYCDLLRLEEAEQTFRGVLETVPDNVEATIGLGETARLRGDSDAALDYFEAAAKLAPLNLRAKLAIRSLKTAEGTFNWQTEIEEAIAIAQAPDASTGAQLSAATVLVEYGLTDVAGPVISRLQTRSPAARQLFFAIREIERLGLAQPLFADDEGPDSADSQLNALQGFHEKPVAGSDTLLIVFAGRNNRVWMTFSLLHRILRRTGASIVYVRDLQQNWYTQGVVGLGHDYDSTVEAFNAIAGRFGAKRILTLGNCTGCLGALRYGLSLGAQGVLGIAPNVRPIGTLKPEHVARVEAIRRLLPADRKNMHTQFVEAQSRPAVALIYGEQCEPDASDAKYMADVPGVKIAGMPDVVTHDAIKDVLIRGLLEPVLREFVSRGEVSPETLERISTSKSP
jgi:tetratricopeptide (TPR) repeat protein